MEKERLELGNLLDKETLDETAVIRQFENPERARTDLATEGFRYFLQVRKTTGHDRYQQLKRHFWEFRRERKHRAGERFNRENRGSGGRGREGGGVGIDLS